MPKNRLATPDERRVSEIAEMYMEVLEPSLKLFAKKEITKPAPGGISAERFLGSALEGTPSTPVERWKSISALLHGISQYWTAVSNALGRPPHPFLDDLGVLWNVEICHDYTPTVQELATALRASHQFLTKVGLSPPASRLRRLEVELQTLQDPAPPHPQQEEPERHAEGQPPPELILGRTYTRREIHKMFGGPVQEYLPHVNGRVVCGALKPSENPDAPEVILPAFGPMIEHWARVFAAQTDPVPIFLKQRSNAWEFVGLYCVRDLSTEPAVIEEHERRSQRSNISMVLFLERVQ
jgi:hypothetical protein